MKSWKRSARVVGALLVVVAASDLGAQTQRPLRVGQTPGPYLLVPVFKSDVQGVGVQVSDLVRDRLMSDYTMAQLVIIPKQQVVGNLQSSGYSVTDALSPNDLKALANITKSEEYIDGIVTRGGDGTLTLNATLNLTRFPGMAQPLPAMTGAKPGDLAGKFSGEFGRVRKQIDPATNCMNSWRQGNILDAMSAAQKALKEYENSVFARICMLEIANSQKWGPDSIIKYAEQTLQIAPNNSRALILVADAYAAKNDEDKYIATLEKLLQADPGNTQLQVTIVKALVASGKTEVALPVIDSAVKKNPGDPELVHLQWNVHLSLKDWKGAAQVGETMARVDTAAADTTFWQQLVGAYVSDSNSQKAAEAAARGANKFPKNATLWINYAQLARQNGQNSQALEAINRVLEIDPKYPGANFQKARIYLEQDNTDSMMAALRAAAAAGEDKATAAAMVLPKAGEVMKAFQQSQDMQQGDKALALATFADSLNPSPTSAFLVGVTNLLMGQVMVTQAGENKTCVGAKDGKDHLVNAQIILPKAGADANLRGNVASSMDAVMKLSDYADQVIKAYCKSSN